MRSQSSRRKFLASAITAMALFLIIGIRFIGRAESKALHKGIPTKTGDTAQEKSLGQCPQDQMTFLRPEKSSIQLRRAIE